MPVDVFAVGQSLDSSFFRLPLRFARQQLPQLGALKPKEACSIPADLLLLPPGLREPMLATGKVSLAGGLCVVRYEFMKQGTVTKFEYRSHGFISSHYQCKQLCQDGWFLVGLAMSRGVLQLLCSEQLPTAEMEEKLHGNEQRKRSRELSLQMRQSDDDFGSADVVVNLDRLQAAKRHQQYMAQHHAAALQDWQQQHPDSVVQSQERQSAASSSAGSGLKAPQSAGQLGLQEQHQQDRQKCQQDSDHHQPCQHKQLQQRNSRQQQSFQHRQLQQLDSLASNHTGQLPSKLHPALGTRASSADAAVDLARLQEAKHNQQPLQDWQQQQQQQQQRPDSPPHSQQGALNSTAYTTHQAQHTGQPSLQQQERQQDSKQQQSYLHRQLQQQDSLASDRTAQLPPRLRPALSSRGRDDSDPTGAMQHHSHATSNKKKVTWADEGDHGVGANTAAAAGQASSTNQEAALWQDLLLLQQLQQVSALSVRQLQLLVQELTALDSTASSSGCGGCLWSDQAGSCAGSHCFNNHTPSQPSAKYQQRAALMQRYAIRPGAAGQYHVQLQHVKTMLAAVQGHAQAPPLPAQQQPAPPLPHKQEQQPQLSLHAELQEAQHSSVLHWVEVADEQDKLSAFEPACSDTSAHTCDSAPGMAADSGAFGDDVDAQGCFSCAAATPEHIPAGLAPTAARCMPVIADVQRGRDHVSSASATPEMPADAASTAGSGALASAGGVLRVLANSHGASATQDTGLAEPRRSSWPLPPPAQQQQESSGVAAAGTQAEMAGAAEVTLERNMQFLQAPAQHGVSASAQQAAWQQLPASTVKYAWVDGAVTQQHGTPAAGRDAMQDFSCGADGTMRPCAFNNTACMYSWVPAPAVAATAGTLGQAGALASTAADAGQVSDSGPQHSPAVSQHHLAVPPADQTSAGPPRALAGGSNAAAGTALQQAADMLEAQRQAADTMDVDTDLQRSHHGAAPAPSPSVTAGAAAAADVVPAADSHVGAQSQDKLNSTAPGPSDSTAAAAAACADAAPAAAAAGAAPVWPLPVPEDGPLVFDWQTHKHQLPGLAAAAAEPGKQKVVPLHIVQHQPGQQQPLSHHLLALGLLTKTDFRIYGGALSMLLHKLELCGKYEVTGISCAAGPLSTCPAGVSSTSGKRLPGVTLHMHPIGHEQGPPLAGAAANVWRSLVQEVHERSCRIMTATAAGPVP